MGYTHYYFRIGQHDPERWSNIFPQLSADAALLIAATRVSIKDGSGRGDPTLTKDVISLNGEEGDAHEDFLLRRNSKRSGGCTKTERKPYDVVVTAILIRATQLLGSDYMDQGGRKNQEISSDGEWNEWRRGRKLVRKVFPNDSIVCPWDAEEDVDQ